MFKFIVPVFLLAAVCFAENPLANFHKTGNYLEDGLAIESHFKDVLKTGIPEWKLPVMEPFHIAEPVNVNLPEYKVDITNSNIKIEGISSAHSIKFGFEPKGDKGFHEYELTNVKVTGHSKKIYNVEPQVVVDHEFSVLFPKLSFNIVRLIVVEAKKTTLEHFEVKFLEAPVYEIDEILKKALVDHPELNAIVEHTKSNTMDYYTKSTHPVFLKVADALGEYYTHALNL